MTEKQFSKVELKVLEFLKKKGYIVKLASKKVHNFLHIDWSIDNTAYKFESVKKINGVVKFQGVNGKLIGWFRNSRAQRLALYVEEEKNLYMISLPGTRRYIRETKGKMVDGYYSVDLELLRSEGLIWEEISLGTSKKKETAKK